MLTLMDKVGWSLLRGPIPRLLRVHRRSGRGTPSGYAHEPPWAGAVGYSSKLQQVSQGGVR
jgi:hypothetical protein